MAGIVRALAKSQRSRQMNFTSLLPVTSGHCTEWQKPGHNASPGHWYALTQVRSLSKWISGCYADHAVENTFLVAQPMQLARKSHPPEGRSSRHPSAHKGAKTGRALTLRNAASLQKHCSVARKARVKQVRPWTYPSMVYVPLCTKLEMSDINRGN